jgi:hypothetical protein
MLRHVAWFNEAPIAPRPEGGLTSSDEGVRLRCLVPARAIELLGVGVSVFGNLQDANPMQVSQHLQKLNSDIVVIGEITGGARVRLARAAKHLGCYVVADFANEEIASDDLAQLMQVADQVVAANADIANLIKDKTGVIALVIPDCEEETKGAFSPHAIAGMWMECFKQLKLKPPAGANTNVPQQAQG